MRKYLFIALTGALLIFFASYTRKSQISSPQVPSTQSLNTDRSKTSDLNQNVNHETPDSDKSNPISSTDSASPQIALSQMIKTIYDAVMQKQSYDRLLGALQSEHQDPFVIRRANPYTGELRIVRTKSPLPGTRYFHAQYFFDEKGEPFVQNISFEYKPSPHSMMEAKRAVRSTFGNLGKPTLSRPDFIKWELSTGYNVWIKTMTLEDLTDDPFNAYSPEDVGTIQVTIELDPHA